MDCCSYCDPLEFYKAIEESTRREHQARGTGEEESRQGSRNGEGERSQSHKETS